MGKKSIGAEVWEFVRDFPAALWQVLCEEGRQIGEDYVHNGLKQLNGTPGLYGPDYDCAYANKHGETPAEKRLREWEEERGYRKPEDSDHDE